MHLYCASAGILGKTSRKSATLCFRSLSRYALGPLEGTFIRPIGDRRPLAENRQPGGLTYNEHCPVIKKSRSPGRVISHKTSSEVAADMKTKSKIFAGLAVLLSAALVLIFILKSPSREADVVEGPQAPEDFEVDSLAAFNLSHVKYRETEAKNRVASCISKRYKITSDAARKITQLAEQVASKHQLDPNLILAIIANESKFHPLLVSPVGALGLMQIMPNVHKRKLAAYGGENAAYSPVFATGLGFKF